MAKSGRPTKYQDSYPKQAEKLCMLGATNADIADFFEVSERTIDRWKKSNEEFCRALKVGKEHADNRVERSLYERAMGYSHPDVHISNFKSEIKLTEITKHYPPDTTACIFWLKNRQPDAWRDKSEVVVQDDTELDKKEIARRMAYLLKTGRNAEDRTH